MPVNPDLNVGRVPGVGRVDIAGARGRNRHQIGQRAQQDIIARTRPRIVDAENMLIVDLWRNDRSRVCEDESIKVAQLCQLESYEYVQHLVSAVVGRLAPTATNLDVLRAAFPAEALTI